MKSNSVQQFEILAHIESAFRITWAVVKLKEDSLSKFQDHYLLATSLGSGVMNIAIKKINVAKRPNGLSLREYPGVNLTQIATISMQHQASYKRCNRSCLQAMFVHWSCPQTVVMVRPGIYLCTEDDAAPFMLRLLEPMENVDCAIHVGIPHHAGVSMPPPPPPHVKCNQASGVFFSRSSLTSSGTGHSCTASTLNDCCSVVTLHQAHHAQPKRKISNFTFPLCTCKLRGFANLCDK